MSARLAAHSAVGFSILALVACVVAIPIIYQKISSIYSELQNEIDEFKVNYNQEAVLLQLIANPLLWLRLSPKMSGRKL